MQIEAEIPQNERAKVEEIWYRLQQAFDEFMKELMEKSPYLDNPSGFPVAISLQEVPNNGEEPLLSKLNKVLNEVNSLKFHLGKVCPIIDPQDVKAVLEELQESATLPQTQDQKIRSIFSGATKLINPEHYLENELIRDTIMPNFIKALIRNMLKAIEKIQKATRRTSHSLLVQPDMMMNALEELETSMKILLPRETNVSRN